MSNLTQTTAGLEPVDDGALINGLRTIQFDSVDEFLNGPPGGDQGGFFAVVEFDNFSSDHYVAGFGDRTQVGLGVGSNTSGVIKIDHTDGVIARTTAGTVAMLISTPIIIRCRWDITTEVEVSWTDGTNGETIRRDLTELSTLGSNNYQIGKGFAPANLLAGRIGRLVIYDQRPDDIAWEAGEVGLDDEWFGEEPSPPPPPSEGRAPFQIMAYADYSRNNFGTPGSNHLVSGTVVKAWDGVNGQPHFMEQRLTRFFADTNWIPKSAPWNPIDKQHVKDRLTTIAGNAGLTVVGDTVTDKIVYLINGESGGGPSPNPFFVFKRPALPEHQDLIDDAVIACVDFLEAVKEVMVNALVGWYAMPSGLQQGPNFGPLSTALEVQAPVLDLLDILPPEIYYGQGSQGDVSGETNTFLSKIDTIRAAYPDKLLCPFVWEEFFSISGLWYDRNEGQSCPISGQGGAATNETYDRTGNPICGPTFLNLTQWNTLLQGLYDAGCDGYVKYNHAGRTHGDYWTNTARSGIRGDLAFAASLDGAVPIGSGNRTFLHPTKGPFAP